MAKGLDEREGLTPMYGRAASLPAPGRWGRFIEILVRSWRRQLLEGGDDETGGLAPTGQ